MEKLGKWIGFEREKTSPPRRRREVKAESHSGVTKNKNKYI